MTQQQQPQTKQCSRCNGFKPFESFVAESGKVRESCGTCRKKRQVGSKRPVVKRTKASEKPTHEVVMLLGQYPRGLYYLTKSFKEIGEEVARGEI